MEMLIEWELDSVRKVTTRVRDDIWFVCTDLDIAVPSWEMLEKA
jgi:hypothetical protein